MTLHEIFWYHFQENAGVWVSWVGFKITSCFRWYKCKNERGNWWFIPDGKDTLPLRKHTTNRFNDQGNAYILLLNSKHVAIHLDMLTYVIYSWYQIFVSWNLSMLYKSIFLTSSINLVQCEDPRCNIWQHMACVLIPEKSMEGVLPNPPDTFYCEICRLNRADP